MAAFLTNVRNTYYDNEALNERLSWLAEQHPDIMQLSTLGTSYEGRQIPLVILTNRATGADLELDLPDGATLKSGKKRQEIGHLEGRSNKMNVTSAFRLSATDNRAKIEWLLHAPTGGTLTLHLIGGRAGTLHREVTL